MAAFPTVLILAGGLGTRLGSIQKDLPKSMVDVLGQPFIQHQLQLLKTQGVENVILCVGYRQKALCAFVGDGSQFGLNVTYSSDGEKALGTGGAVLKASTNAGSPFAVLYGDSYLEAPLGPIIQTFADCGKEALMTVYHNRNQCAPSNILVRDGCVTAYNKKDPTPEMEYIDFGLSIYSKAAFEGMSESEAFDLAEVTTTLISRKQLACFEVNVPFHEVGSIEGLKELESHLRNREKAISANDTAVDDRR